MSARGIVNAFGWPIRPCPSLEYPVVPAAAPLDSPPHDLEDNHQV